MYFVYILENQAGRLYVGQTDNVPRRVEQHNDPQKGSGKYTHKNGPWVMVYTEHFATRAAAVTRERFIKSRKSALWIRENLLKGRASPDVHRD
jgi:putative endonuclease